MSRRTPRRRSRRRARRWSAGTGRASSAADVFLQICGRHGISETMLADLRARGQAITESARQPTPPPGAAMLEQSGRHQRLVSIEGAKAWATRRMAGSATEEVGFVRRKTAWYIRLFARRR